VQKKAVYGTMDACRLFTDQFKQAAGDEGWVEVAESTLAQQTASKVPQALMPMHVDDLLVFAPQPVSQLRVLSSKFEMDAPVPLDNGHHTYVGMDIEFAEGGRVCRLGQASYAAAITTGLSDKELRRAVSQLDLADSVPADVCPSLVQEQQKWVGVLGWMAKTQPHLSVAFSDISRSNTRPSQKTLLSAKRLCEYAKLTHKPLVFNNTVKRPVLVMWVDASYDVASCTGRLGWELQLLDASEVGGEPASFPTHNVIAWRSMRCVRKLVSSTAAELLALKEGIKVMPLYSSLVKSLWEVEPEVVFYTDSSPLLDWLTARYCTKDPQHQGSLEYCLERLEECGHKVLWVPTKHQRADKHTKFVRVC
jgi:hypothetical protein